MASWRWRCGVSCGDDVLCLILAGATDDVSSTVSSHPCCCVIKGDAIVAGDMTVWDVINFQFLLQQHLINDVLMVG